MALWEALGEEGFSPEKNKGERRLLLDCEVECQGTTYTIRALVDTGAEVNVIRGGIIPEADLVTLDQPRRLTAANQQAIIGGDKEARVVIHLTGLRLTQKSPVG